METKAWCQMWLQPLAWPHKPVTNSLAQEACKLYEIRVISAKCTFLCMYRQVHPCYCFVATCLHIKQLWTYRESKHNHNRLTLSLLAGAKTNCLSHAGNTANRETLENMQTHWEVAKQPTSVTIFQVQYRPCSSASRQACTGEACLATQASPLVQQYRHHHFVCCELLWWFCSCSLPQVTAKCPVPQL